MTVHKTKTHSIRAHLLGLVLVLFLTTSLGLAYILSSFYESSKQAILNETQITTRSLSTLIDRELDIGKNITISLATSHYLKVQDLASFHAQASSLVRGDFPGMNFVLSDKTGQQLINTLKPFGSELPSHNNLEQLKKVFEEKRPLISDVFSGGVVQKPVLALDVPVFNGEEVVFCLSVGLLPSYFESVLLDQKFPESRRVAIFDSQGVLVAQSKSDVVPKFQQEIMSSAFRSNLADEGNFKAEATSGLEIKVLHRRSTSSNWILATAVLSDSVVAAATANIIPLALVGLAFFLTGALLIIRFGNQIQTSMLNLVQSARSIGSGHVTTNELDSKISEIKQLILALKTADSDLHAHRSKLESLVQSRTEELQLVSEQLSDAQRIASVGSWKLDLSSNEVWWSRELYEIFRMEASSTPPNLEQQEALMTSDSWVTLNKALKHTTNTGQPYELELEICRANGQRGWIIAKGELLGNESGVPVAIQGVAMDITFRKEAELALELSKKQAESANKAKSTFLAVMSHEIRTPLNAIIGASYLLEKDAVSESQRKNLAAISASGKGLLALINDVLDFSKIEADELILDEIEFSLNEVLEDSRSIFAPLAKDKSIDFDLSIDEALGKPILKGAVDRLRQILLNLLSNAIKFTDRGQVSLSVNLLSSDANGIYNLQFVVSDTGVGISKDVQPLLFNPFVQAESSTSREYGGTGLGLAIVKKLSQLMKGSVSLESEIGKGTTFYVELPFQLVKSEKQEGIDQFIGLNSHDGQEKPLSVNQSSTPRSESPLSGYRIMVVDDSELNLLILEQILKAEGAEVVMCNSGQVAIDKVSESKVDAILMDLQMPKMDGCQTTLAIRERIKDGIPIIALTAGATTTERSRAEASGMDSFLTKPVDPPNLMKVLLAQIDKARNR